MLYKNPSSKKEKACGFVESYKFKETSSIDLTLETNIGGYETIEVSKDDRVLYILKGLAFAKMSGKSFRLEEGFALEVPAGQEVEITSGQLQFLCIKARG